MTASWLSLLDEAIKECTARDRPDLGWRLRHRRHQLGRGKLRVVVLGERGQGKSQLVNALLNAPVCAVGDELTTRAPAVIEHNATPAAEIVSAGGHAHALESANRAAERTETPVESATARANSVARGDSGPVRAQIGLPAPLLADGLTLVDTPGIAGPDSPSTAAALSEVFAADAVLIASDATAELSETELDLLTRISTMCAAVMIAFTKIDIVPRWRDVLSADRARLAQLGIPATVVPVSAAVRMAAARSGDTVLNGDSGFETLLARLRSDWINHAEQLNRRSAATLTGMALEQLSTPLREELTATRQADSGPAVARWRALGRELEEVQRRSARVQTVLADEVADLTSDVEYDLRDRTRQILQRADEYFDEADPEKSWHEFEAWLTDNLAAAADANITWLWERFDGVAGKVAHMLSPADAELLATLPATEPLPEPDTRVRMPAFERFGAAAKLFVGIRGSYGGLLMVGLASTLVDMPLINPLSIAAGAAFGIKAVFEERAARLKRRQASAKTAAQRHVDGFFLTYSKETKDLARLLQRALRDHISEWSEQRRAELTAEAKSVKETIDADSARRTRRERELTAALQRINTLHARVRSVSADASRGSPLGLTA
ncbi:dynamin family protein [Haloechinothrix sp. LS1_15]|uniref:dynamin family protein n=1 Tax=Haloechinothrix sp. LS1_15 TaxID=2652248 RepID=UPI00294B859D|nr:dynamin family protein [Haloechinothrix sp. LS1_15]